MTEDTHTQPISMETNAINITGETQSGAGGIDPYVSMAFRISLILSVVFLIIP